jgi:hypothetical protein
MKTVLLLNFYALTIWSCNSKTTADTRQIDTVATKSETVSTDTSLADYKVFSQIATFPTISDSAKFITELLDKFELEVDNDSPTTSGSITTYKKIKLNGSDKDFILVEYDWMDGCMAAFPWKYQLIFTTGGKHIQTLSADRYDFIQIFPNQNPYLLALVATAKGNGGHEIYKVTADTLENVYEGYYDYTIRTYDAHGDNTLYEPHQLQLTIQDKNGDGLNDITFKGKLLYDDGIKNYTTPLEFIFLYDKQTGHFRAKENYEKKYGLNE